MNTLITMDGVTVSKEPQPEDKLICWRNRFPSSSDMSSRGGGKSSSSSSTTSGSIKAMSFYIVNDAKSFCWMNMNTFLALKHFVTNFLIKKKRRETTMLALMRCAARKVSFVVPKTSGSMMMTQRLFASNISLLSKGWLICSPLLQLVNTRLSMSGFMSKTV